MRSDLKLPCLLESGSMKFLYILFQIPNFQSLSVVRFPCFAFFCSLN